MRPAAPHTTRRAPLESEIQRDVMLALGALPGVLVYRNSVGVAEYTDADGKRRTVRYGLDAGTPDLVLIVDGRTVGLELKRPGESATEEQARVHRQWRAVGAFAAVVTSVEEARAAVARARAGALE